MDPGPVTKEDDAMTATTTAAEALAAAEAATIEQDAALDAYEAAQGREARGETEGSRQEAEDARERYEAAQTRCESRWADYYAVADADGPADLYARVTVAYGKWRAERAAEAKAKRQAEADYATYRLTLRRHDAPAELEAARASQRAYEAAQEREARAFRAWCEVADAAADADEAAGAGAKQ